MLKDDAMKEYEILIIGGGTTAEYAASNALKNTTSVAMVEKDKVGGDCIFHACIPTKALVQAARAYKKAQTLDFYGLPVLKEKVDYKNVKRFKDKIVTSIGIQGVMSAGASVVWIL